MKTIAILLPLAALLLSSCKKDYTCECFNPSGVVATHTIHGTHQEAVTICKKYSDEYQTVPMSESGCVLR